MKLLFFDIDGTLISEDGRNYLPTSSVKAIRKARENGHKAFVNTGRCKSFIGQNIRDIGFDGYVCGCGTEIIIDGKHISHGGLERSVCILIAEMILKKGIDAIFEGSEFTKKTAEITMTDEKGKMSVYSPEFLFDKYMIWDENEVDDEIKSVNEKYFNVIYREIGALENVPKGYNKAMGMEKVAQFYGLTTDDCIAFGDSVNDIEMIKAAGISVTMGKCPEVDCFADIVTQSLENDGIEKAMKRLKLI